MVGEGVLVGLFVEDDGYDYFWVFVFRCRLISDSVVMRKKINVEMVVVRLKLEFELWKVMW